MKLAIVRQRYTPYGGAERFVERALGSLRQQGVDVTMVAREFSASPAPQPSNNAPNSNAPSHPNPNSWDGGTSLPLNPFYLGRLWRDWSFMRAVQDVIAQGRFDLVQSHERIPGCHIFRAGDGVHATWLELRAQQRGKTAALLDGLSPWHRFTLNAEAAMFGHSSLRAVICISRMVRDDVQRRFPATTNKLHVIYNGLDLDYFHPRLRSTYRHQIRAQLGLNEDRSMALLIGSGFERKGVYVLLQALGRMKCPVHLVIVGKDRYAARAERIAQNLGVQKYVSFIGGVADTRPWYGAADFFCLPTLYDPLSNAVIEALACGLPVLTSTSCGASEFIKPGVNGEVCNALDVDGIADRMDELSSRAGDMRDAARSAVSHLSLENMAEQLQTLYTTLLSKE